MVRKSKRMQQQYEQSLSKTLAKNAAKAAGVVRAVTNPDPTGPSMETTLQKKFITDSLDQSKAGSKPEPTNQPHGALHPASG